MLALIQGLSKTYELKVCFIKYTGNKIFLALIQFRSEPFFHCVLHLGLQSRGIYGKQVCKKHKGYIKLCLGSKEFNTFAVISLTTP